MYRTGIIFGLFAEAFLTKKVGGDFIKRIFTARGKFFRALRLKGNLLDELPTGLQNGKRIQVDGIGYDTRVPDGKRVKWIDAKNLTDSNLKGKASEDISYDLLGGVGNGNLKQKYKGKNIGDFNTKYGGREVDIYDKLTGKAHEIKNYKRNLSVHDVRKQVLKDVELMKKLGPKKYRPIWHFLDAGPTQMAKEFLEKYGIEYIIYK